MHAMRNLLATIILLLVAPWTVAQTTPANNTPAPTKTNLSFQIGGSMLGTGGMAATPAADHSADVRLRRSGSRYDSLYTNRATPIKRQRVKSACGRKF